MPKLRHLASEASSEADFWCYLPRVSKSSVTCWICFDVFLDVFFQVAFGGLFERPRRVLLEGNGCQKEPKVSNILLERRVFAELVETRFDL